VGDNFADDHKVALNTPRSAGVPPANRKPKMELAGETPALPEMRSGLTGFETGFRLD
jgi:hypothetical protein